MNKKFFTRAERSTRNHNGKKKIRTKERSFIAICNAQVSKMIKIHFCTHTYIRCLVVIVARPISYVCMPCMHYDIAHPQNGSYFVKYFNYNDYCYFMLLASTDILQAILYDISIYHENVLIEFHYIP